ncbi:MAG: prolyl oligopeptidase family serine peptidase [Gemmatimonadota bacterium]
MRQLSIASLALACLAASAQAQANRAPATTIASSKATDVNFTADDAIGITTIAAADLTDDGRYIAATATLRRDGFGTDYRHDGDPTYLRVAPARVMIIDTKSGTSTDVFKEKRPVRSLRWAPDGRRLAMLIFNGDVLEPAIWDKSSSKLTTLKLPAGSYVAENSDIRWSADGKSVLVASHTLDWRKSARETFANMTAGPVFVQSSKDPFLAWDDVRRLANMRSVVAIDVATGLARERLPASMIANYTVAEDGSAVSFNADIAKKTDYDSFNAETALRVRDSSGTERTIKATTKGLQFTWADDGKRYAYSNNGRVYIGTIADSSAKMILGAPEPKRGETPDTSKAARDKAALERFSVVRYSPAGDALLVSNKEGMWLADIASGAREKVAESSDSSETLPRVAFAGWTPDGQHIYLTSTSRQKWERGILRYDRPTKQLKELVKDGRNYSNFRLSKDGSTIVLGIAAGNRPADLYAANPDLSNLRRLAESNPQLSAKRIGPTDLVSFIDADGHSKKAVVYFPADYEKGKTYPTVFEIYEDYFDDTFDVRANVLTGHGYVVVKPAVDFDIGYPGEAWIKGVSAAANKLIEMGIADSARLGVQGQSYGGYATNLLITQTNRFKAAVNISGKVDMISFYTDSPRLGVRNVNAAEKTQDRLGATLWAQPQKYVAHSAIMFADRITTPLLLVTGGLDSNVPADNTREMYYALRRLGKEVVWVNYMNGGHGGGTATAEDFLDMHKRVLEFYDSKLKAPKSKLATNN